MQVATSRATWPSVEALGCECAVDGKQRIRLVLPPALEIQSPSTKRPPAEGVQIRHLDYKRDSLQDIFLKAMEQG